MRACSANHGYVSGLLKIAIGLALLVPMFCHAASATSAYPNRPVRFVVPFAPSGSADTYARAIGFKLTEVWNHQVIIDNRAGLNGILGHDIVAKAPRDGHTLMLGVMASIAVNPALHAKLPYDPYTSFDAVTLATAAPYLMVVTPALPAKTVREFIDLAKSKPRQINYVSTGSGSAPHLAAVLFQNMTGVEMVHIPYKGSAVAMVDLLSGQVQMEFKGLVNAGPQVKAGKLRAIAISSGRRSSIMPNVPTVAESGVPGFEVTGWYGVFVPAGTSQEIVARLNSEIVRVLGMPDIRERWRRFRR